MDGVMDMKRLGRRALFLALAGVMGAMLIWPGAVRAAVAEGVALCLGTAIPSLFPFFVVSSLLIDLGYAQALGRRLAGVMGPLFSLSGSAAAAVVLGAVGGYPVGADAARRLWEQKAITREEAGRLLGFCNNGSPAFAVSVLGAGVFHSARAGLWLWGIHIVSALLTGVLLRRRGKAGVHRAVPPLTRPLPFSQALIHSAAGAARSMVGVCAFVLLFSVAVMPLKPIGGQMGAAITSFVELFNGAARLRGTSDAFPLAAALLSWGGLSVHCQTLSVTPGLSHRWYWQGKVLQCLLSFLLAYLLKSSFAAC